MEEPPFMEERENQGGAMQVTSIREGKGSNRHEEEDGNDAPPQKHKSGLGLKGVGSEDKWPKPFIKGEGSRASQATNPPIQFSTLLIIYLISKEIEFLIVVPQIQCLLT